MQIITISGLDGSGKSIQIELLKKYLESQGKKVFYFHAVEFGLANKISEKKNGKAKSVATAGAFKIWLRKIFLKIDLRRFKKLLAKLEKEDYDYLVSDRYFYDSVVNIAFLKNNGIACLAGRQAAVAALPRNDIIKPDIAVYLKASPEIIMQRERKPDQGLEYLHKKEKLYDELAKKYDLKIVDGNRNKEEIFEEMKKYAF